MGYGTTVSGAGIGLYLRAQHGGNRVMVFGSVTRLGVQVGNLIRSNPFLNFPSVVVVFTDSHEEEGGAERRGGRIASLAGDGCDRMIQWISKICFYLEGFCFW